MAKVIFSFNGIQTIIQCLKEDKMKNICNKYVSKINININSLIFIYGGNKINYEISFQEQANSIDKERNEINILVYKEENENEIKCSKCGEIIKIDKFENIIQLNNNQNDMLNELKSLIETINDSNEINKIKNKIKLINLVIINLMEENEKIMKNISNIVNINVNEIKNDKKNIIKGIFNVEDTYQDIIIFNQWIEDEGIDENK